MLFQKHTGGSPGSPHPEERKEAGRPREQEKEARRFEALSHRKHGQGGGMRLRSSTATYSRRWSRRSSWEKETTPTRSSSSSRRSSNTTSMRPSTSSRTKSARRSKELRISSKQTTLQNRR